MRNIDRSLATGFMDQLNQEQSSSFMSPSGIQTVMLEPGDTLYRFVMHQHYPFSEYWFGRDTYSSLFGIYKSQLVQAEFERRMSTRRRITEITQTHLAVLHQFKGAKRDFYQVNFIVKFLLHKEIIAFHGKTAAQHTMMPITKKDKVRYKSQQIPLNEYYEGERVKERRLGGMEQIVVPRFASLKNDGEAIRHEDYGTLTITPF
jgi:hypothetical protein